MKKIAFIVAFLLVAGATWAQKYAFVDTDYILENIPAYTAAQQQLDQISNQYQKELETMHAELEKMYSDYQTEAVLLSDDMKRKREDVIISKEKEYKSAQRQYFGPEGELYKKREGFVKPIQDDIFNAVQEIANEGSYAVIFDKSGGMSMLYTNPKFDLSDQVLQKLGYKN
ncbi:OmpH family outer membrane protein [Mangrovibacterium marinum]|uniref:Periplasmic chaperone for outer membrane proteins Skp n=1 Tax=Mangrovibacterium marinum TaxID=1639118 RepID=A0A2T5C3X3_9BACT|nr:OmpH family outer membrane protein [Mangrovibacterium marinum]PTN09515.1 periplasmic chaperone for outer membrane proteins Skp [Mangrovibacterium marinum]